MNGGWFGAAAHDEWSRRVFAMQRTQPHYKPAMLLAALDLIDDGAAEPGRVPVHLLAERFAALLDAAGLGTGNARMPLWHLAESSPTREPFWRIVMRDGGPPRAQPQIGSVASVAFLPEFVAPLAALNSRWSARQAVYALLDADGRPEATQLLAAWPEHLGEMRSEEAAILGLLNRTFSLDDDAAYMVSGSRSAVVRDRAFAKLVALAYEHGCALCSERVRWRGAHLVQAGHVKPRALRGADDLRNGLALCPSHHWSFDRFLWTIGEQLEVRVRAPERGADLSALDRFRSGARIRPPRDERLRVHADAIAWHASRFESDARAG